jgi:hypothetical protein
LGFVFSSETLVGHAYVGLAIVCLITLFMILWIVFLRIRLYLSQQYQARFEGIWQPIFTEIALYPHCYSKGAEVPSLRRRDFFLFMNCWLGFQESLSGKALVRLNGLARQLKLHVHAQHLLQKGRMRQRLVALVFLGNLRDRASWPVLEKLLANENSLLSLLSARALIQIDQERALPLVLAELVRREDWPEARVAVLLRSVLTAELATPPLFEALQNSTDPGAIKLLPYVEHMYNEERNRILRILLERSRSDRLTSRILKRIQCSQELALVRQYVSHGRWHLRMQAVAALGRIGQRSDIPLLLERLGDEEWWVRYRASQALLKMPGMTHQEIETIRDNMEDSFARTMLEQAMTEEGGQR